MMFVRAMPGVVSLCALVSAASAVPVTTWNYDGASLQYVRNDDGVFWSDYDSSENPDVMPDVVGTPFPNGLKLAAGNSYDRVFRVTDQTYLPTPSDPATGQELRGNRLIMSGTGTIDGSQWDHPDDTIRTHFAFGFGFSGGTFDLYTIETGFTLLDAEGNFITGVGSVTGFGVFDTPGGYGYGFDFVDRFGADITSAVTIQWTVSFLFDWNGYAEGDSVEFYIPQNSVDIIAERVPAPGGAALLGVAGLGAIRRRR